MKRLIKLAIMLAVFWWLWTRVPAVESAVEAPLNLARGLAVSVELHNMKKLLMMERTLEGRLPTEAEFAGHMRRRLEARGKDPLADPWGVAYLYRVRNDAFELRSAGPDRRFGSDDDLTLTWRNNA